MQVSALILLIAAAGQVAGESGDLSPGLGVIEADALIKVRGEDDQDIPAREEGVLVELAVRDGAVVAKGELIGRIDDSIAQAQLEIADYALKGARKRAEDDIELRYAKAQSAVTKTDWQQDMIANERMKNAVPDITIRRKKLDYDRSVLQIEKARHDAELALLDAQTKLAEKKAAELAIERRGLVAPFDGLVQKVYTHQHEWVKIGDPVVHLMRLDKLHVECFVDSTQYDPIDVIGRPVTLTVDLARNRTEQLSGHVVYYSHKTQADGHYLVRAEVENRREGNHWVVRPGLPATITIRVTEPAVAGR